MQGEAKYKTDSLGKIALQKFLKNKLAVIGAIIIILIIASAIIVPWITEYNPDKQDLLNQLSPPSKEHLLGTDDLGRDVFSRLLYGSRVSLSVGFLAVAGMMIIGTVIGAIAGYFGGIFDSVLMRFVDVIISFPQIFLLITLIAVLQPSLNTLIIVFALFSWTSTARLVRGEFLSLRNREFVLAARTMGIRTWKIIFSHILPNAMGPVIVSATLQIGYVILAESTLSYLGLGVQPPTPSWGNMLQSAQDYNIMLNAWWYPLFPGFMILITILSFNFVGDGLRDALDPKVRK
ncbi:oligopeptide ABC transporter permease [Ornithinibacillus sp. 4-3]|uniref:Oligopeptide ABC transporter permease n=1 Tax=Ornithinibacillus sp. 4-3 TaxID=3231488 RepID=A0AB39HST3_9BACI